MPQEKAAKKKKKKASSARGRKRRAEPDLDLGSDKRHARGVEEDLVDAIKNDRPYNEAERGAIASLVTSMGRMAAHTGQVITYDQMFNHDHELAPGLDQLTFDSPAPLKLGPDGKYPIPQPGVVTDREYDPNLPAQA